MSEFLTKVSTKLGESQPWQPIRRLHLANTCCVKINHKAVTKISLLKLYGIFKFKKNWGASLSHEHF